MIGTVRAIWLQFAGSTLPARNSSEAVAQQKSSSAHASTRPGLERQTAIPIVR